MRPTDGERNVCWSNMKDSVARDATRRWALLFGVGYELSGDLDFREIRACARVLGVLSAFEYGRARMGLVVFALVFCYGWEER